MNNKTLLYIDLPLLLVYASAYIVFLVSLFRGWNAGVIVGAIIIFICMLFAIIKPLISKSKIRLMDWIDIIINILGAVVLVIAFASASDSNVKDAVIQVSAATIGGLLTLYGVGITIKYNQLEKKEYELKRIKPYIFPISEVTWGNLPKEKKRILDVAISEEKSDIKPSKDKKNNYRIDSLLIANSDQSMCALCGILLDDKIINFEYSNVLLKDSFNLALVQYDFALEEDPETMYLLLEDMLHNNYLAELRFETKKQDRKKIIQVKSILDIELIEE